MRKCPLLLTNASPGSQCLIDGLCTRFPREALSLPNCRCWGSLRSLTLMLPPPTSRCQPRQCTATHSTHHRYCHDHVAHTTHAHAAGCCWGQGTAAAYRGHHLARAVHRRALSGALPLLAAPNLPLLLLLLLPLLLLQDHGVLHLGVAGPGEAAGAHTHQAPQ